MIKFYDAKLKEMNKEKAQQQPIIKEALTKN